MTNQEIRAAILETAYRAARKTGSITGGMFSIYEISKDWGEEDSKIEFNADYLNKKGLVKWVASHGMMGITAEGVDLYEEGHEEEEE